MTIIDNMRTGMLSFESAAVTVSEKDKWAVIRVLRSDGCEGKIKCRYETFAMVDHPLASAPYQDYTPKSGVLLFDHGETLREIKIEIIEKNFINREDMFRVKLFSAEGGAKITKRDTMTVTVVGDLETKKAVERIQSLVHKLSQQKYTSYFSQFKKAVMLSPHIDEDGNIEEFSCFEAFLHLLTIGWKVAFCIIPSAKWRGGWVCFILSFAFAGVLTLFMGEFAELFSCHSGLKREVTAVLFFSVGTSLPEFFATVGAAKESASADAAIGHSIASVAYNLLFGFGFSWLIGAAYYDSQGSNYELPGNEIGFQTFVLAIIIAVAILFMGVKRRMHGGELGGKRGENRVFAVLLILLWVVFVTLTAVRVHRND